MASADEIYVTVKGKGGHAASPHLCIDPILVASHLIIGLQQIVSRHANPFNPTVLSITSFQGGNTTNVIPESVKLKGTFRAMDESWRTRAHELITDYAVNLANSMGAQIELLIDKGYPSVYNNEQLHEIAKQAAIEYQGPDNIEETELRMGAEDFGYYAQQIPACFYRLGTMNKAKGITSGVHTPIFNIDESAIEIGMGMMAWLGSSVKP